MAKPLALKGRASAAPNPKARAARTGSNPAAIRESAGP